MKSSSYIKTYRNLAIVFILVANSFFGTAQENIIKLNIENSEIYFLIKHLGMLTVNGSFNNISGTLILDNENNIKNLVGKVAVESIDTNSNERDNIILSEAYLNSKVFPNIYFELNKIDRTKDKLILLGNLKIKDVEKQINLQVSKLNKELIVIKTSIKRADFKLSFGAMDKLIGNTINIEFKISTR